MALLTTASHAAAQTAIRIMPPDRGTFAVGQRFDIRIEATSTTPEPPGGLTVTVNGEDVTARNLLDPGARGERGAGGTGATAASLPVHHRAAAGPTNSTNFLVRDFGFDTPGVHVIAARTADGAETQVAVTVDAWEVPRRGARQARNVILLLGDGMGAAHRTAARIVSRGVRDGKARAPLAMDTMDVTGQVMTFALNSVITDSAPGMSSFVTGQKGNNNQVGVFPDNTSDVFDNPRVEYLGALLRRTRGPGFHVGLVTNADVTDATPAGNAIHTANRNASAGIAAQFLDEFDRHGVTVLMGGGARHFPSPAAGAASPAGGGLAERFAQSGFHRISSRREVLDLLTAAGDAGATGMPSRLLGLFHPEHLAVAFDKLGAGRYSDELARPAARLLPEQPMLDEMARLALAALSRHSPAGFYLMIEGASIDKRAHAVDAERTVWDTIEFDNAVRVALDFAAVTNGDDDPTNDTLVIVTADHECGGLAIVGVGNERYAPARLGRAVRDYAAVFRFEAEQALSFIPNYESDGHGYPIDPDPSRKLLLGWAAGPDRHENWLSNRLMEAPTVLDTVRAGTRVAVANPARDGDGDNRAANGGAIPGFLVTGTIENGATGCPAPDGCPADTASEPHTIAGHTATDVPLSAVGPGAWQFTGTYENTDVFIRLLRSAAGSYPAPAEQ